MSRLAASAAAALLLACGCSDAATTPAAADPAGIAAAPALTASMVATGLDFSQQVADIETRMLPSFTDHDAAEQLRGYLQDLAASAAAGDRAAAAASLELARGVLKPGVTSAVDATAIEMTLDVIGRDIQS
ncbi:MAG: hypothetical protein ACJ8J0_05445 [Longimicrobiaceae bacterium]